MTVVTADTQGTLDLAGLEHALRRANPAVVLLPSWLLETLIAADRGLRGPLFAIPHDRSHVIARDRLARLVADEDLRLPDDPPDEPALILLARPDADWLQKTPAPQALLAYWQLLFHATVDGLLRVKREDGTLDGPGVQARAERLGRGAFREAAFVLGKEHALPGGVDDAEAYAEFVATYLELFHFAPWLLDWYFPAAEAGRVLAVLSQDVDAAAVLSRTRPDGAAEPAGSDAATGGIEEMPPAAESAGPISDPRPERSNRKGKSLMRAALAAEASGNDVRAAILRVRAARVTRANGGGSVAQQPAKLRAGALRRIDALASRLRVALDFDEADVDPWRAALRGLLNRADAGWWNNERRLLYDLQKVCVCHEREMYSANVVEWLIDRGRRPLRRPQPAQRLVTAHKALRSAEARAAKARLHPHERAALRRLLHDAVAGAARRLRVELRPAVIHALEEGDLVPRSAVERVAEEKLVDELLDGVERRGYLNLGNLRDAVSRNQLKLNDIAAPRELLGRDQLLRVDRRLEWQLDGVYHRGEVYLRLFQRLSSVLFGTAGGRFLTRVLLIPFLGAFVILEGLDHSVGLLIAKLGGPHPHFSSVPALAAVGLFLMATVNWPAFRAGVARGARALGRGLRAVFLDFPRWLARLPLVRFLFSSQLVRLLFRYAVKPLALSAVALPLLPDGMRPAARGSVLVGLYLLLTLALNSPPGRALEQTLLHALRVTLPRMTWEILVGLFRIVMSAFDRLLEHVDRTIYAVDEWLRFGASHARWTVAVKAVLGVFWFFIAYVTRFVVNLLIEPQINPIKHFPVVTVSHKIMIPATPALAKGLILAGLTEATAWTLAGGIITGTPGIFGFLAWELKENWKLYRANRARLLGPVRVGSHGETFAQLLRPGFHSGTIPKLFARARKAARHGRLRAADAQRAREAAHHVKDDVCAFVERELVSLLNHNPFWARTPVAAGEVELSVTRVSVELRCEAVGPEPAVLSFEQRDGLILAAVERPGWMPALPATQSELLRAALLGFYKLAAVDVSAEHVRAAVEPAPAAFDLRRRKLVVWQGARFERETAYDLAEPTDETRRLLLSDARVPWPAWKRLWDAQTPAEVAELTARIAPGVEVLPAGCTARGRRDVESGGPRPRLAILSAGPAAAGNGSTAAAAATS
jgi:hypothetical protein